MEPGDLVEDEFRQKWRIQRIGEGGTLNCTRIDGIYKTKKFKPNQVKPTEKPAASAFWLGKNRNG